MNKQALRFRSCVVAASAIVALFGPVAGAGAQVETLPKPLYVTGVENPPPEACRGNIRLRGTLADILSNALRIDFGIDARAPQMSGGTSAESLFQEVAAKYKLDPEKLKESIKRHQHINCKHPPVDNSATDQIVAGWKASRATGTAPAPATVKAPAQPAPGEKAPAGPTLTFSKHPQCELDPALAGVMKDAVWNALVLGLGFPEKDVAAYLDKAEERYPDGTAVLKAAAAHYKVSEGALAAEVEKYRHVDCTHGPLDGAPAPTPAAQRPSDGVAASTFAKDVTLHVVLHELGHALIREFDIPVLGNEETAADAFATYYLTTYMPDRAVDVLKARTTSLMIEAGESREIDWGGEHDHDARRANQIAALAVAADSEKYKAVAQVVAMSEDDIRKARDYGGEIRRSWRRVLAPLWMPEGAASNEARVIYDSGNEFLNGLCGSGFASEIEAAVKRFDWHSQVTVKFVDGNGGAAWSRSSRTITVNSSYVKRFVGQGERGLPAGSN